MSPPGHALLEGLGMAAGVDGSTFSYAQCLYHYQLTLPFVFYYMVFGGNGAAANGARP